MQLGGPEQLSPLQQCWRFSEQRSELYKAFAALDLGAVAKGAEVDFVTDKGRIKFAYADLDAILPIVKSGCKANGLAPLQFITYDPKAKSCVVVTHIGHESGQWLEVVMALPVVVDDDRGIDPKKFAGLATYMKRYQISAVFSISTEEDQDGQHLAAPYSGSPEDKRWLQEAFKALPFKLDLDQKKAISKQMKDSGTAMTVEAVTAVYEHQQTPKKEEAANG